MKKNDRNKMRGRSAAEVLQYIEFTSNFTQMWNNHSNLIFFKTNVRYVYVMVFRTILKTPLKRVKNDCKILVMFNSMKMYLAPHLPGGTKFELSRELIAYLHYTM